MPSWHVLMYMLWSIMPCYLMPHICPVAYVFITMNMPKWCSSFLVTSWCHVVSLLLINLCLFWRCSNYMNWIMLWVLCPNVRFYNFGLYMTSVPCLQTCYDDVAVLHFLKLLQHSNLSWCFPLVHEPYGYDALMLFALCYVYFDDSPWLPYNLL